MDDSHCERMERGCRIRTVDPMRPAAFCQTTKNGLPLSTSDWTNRRPSFILQSTYHQSGHPSQDGRNYSLALISLEEGMRDLRPTWPTPWGELSWERPSSSNPSSETREELREGQICSPQVEGQSGTCMRTSIHTARLDPRLFCFTTTKSSVASPKNIFVYILVSIAHFKLRQLFLPSQVKFDRQTWHCLMPSLLRRFCSSLLHSLPLYWPRSCTASHFTLSLPFLDPSWLLSLTCTAPSLTWAQAVRRMSRYCQLSMLNMVNLPLCHHMLFLNKNRTHCSGLA